MLLKTLERLVQPGLKTQGFETIKRIDKEVKTFNDNNFLSKILKFTVLIKDKLTYLKTKSL